MNFPNKLTVTRMLLTVAIVIIALFPYDLLNITVPTFTILDADFTLTRLVMFVLFVIGSITDFVDGHYARKHNLITTFGKFMDPIADKLLVNTVFFLFALEGSVPAFCFIIMLWRDTTVDGVRMLAADNGTVIAAANIGKLKTVVQMVALILVFLHNLPFALINWPVDQVMVWIATLLSFVSGASYVISAKDLILKSK